MEKVYVDLHNCLLMPNGNPNKDMVNLVNTLYKTYNIIIWTADNINYKELENKLPDDLKYNDVAVCTLPGGDDIQRKLYIIKEKDENNIAFIIDNNKHVCKALAKKGINTLRYRIG